MNYGMPWADAQPLAKKKSPKAQMVMVSKSPPVFLVLLTYQPRRPADEVAFFEHWLEKFRVTRVLEAAGDETSWPAAIPRQCSPAFDHGRIALFRGVPLESCGRSVLIQTVADFGIDFEEDLVGGIGALYCG